MLRSGATTPLTIMTPPNRKPIVAVLDTNVVVDIFSVHDYNEVAKRLGPQGLEMPDAQWRRARARMALLFAMQMHATGSRTYSLHREILTILQKCVPPTSQTFMNAYTRIVVNFVKDFVLPHWYFDGDTNSSAKSNQADQFLVDTASAAGAPLVTNEGFSMSGSHQGDIEERAAQKSVNVKHPQEFIAGQVDEQALIERFLRAFKEQGVRYITMAHGRAQSLRKKAMIDVLRYYRHVLLGEADGGKIVAVTWPP
jgi:hypothetical protein